MKTLSSLVVATFALFGLAAAQPEPKLAAAVKAKTPGVSINAELAHGQTLRPIRAATEQETSLLAGVIERHRLKARPSARLTAEMVTQEVGDLEAFIANNPTSPYLPSVRLGLADYYYGKGHFTRGLEHWSKTWQECQAPGDEVARNLGDEVARNLGDHALVKLGELLAALGRLEEVRPLILEQKGRVFSEPSLAQRWAILKEAVGQMRHDPGVAYKCGVYALNNVARALQGKSFADIGEKRSEISGFSLAALAEMASRHQLGLVPAFREAGSAVVVPSLVHWKQNHYAAIVAEENGRYLVKDPTFDIAIWMTAEALDEEASGYFLIPAQIHPRGWQTISLKEAGQIYGKGYRNRFKDDHGPKCDCFPCEDGSGGAGTGSGKPCGMAAWKVQEPNINLAVWDIPMSYEAAYGPSFVLELNWRNRNILTAPYNLSHFIDGWESDLLSFVDGYPSVYQDETNMRIRRGNSYDLLLHFASGATASDPDFDSGVWAVRTVSGGSTTMLDVYYRNGSSEHYERMTVGNAYNMRLISRADATMKSMTFAYDDAPGTSTPNRLLTVTLADGAQFSFSYTDMADDYRITGVSGPNSRSVSFGYSTVSGTDVLSSITDAVGLVSSFEYDSSTWAITKLTTPYGDTTFTHYASDGCLEDSDLACTGVDRSLVVTEPDGSHQVYLFYDNETDEFSGIIPSAFASGQIPSYPTTNDPPVQTLDTIRNQANSHYWNRQQAAALSTLTLSSLTAGDYRLSRTRHWLQSQEYPLSDYTELGWELPPSLDGTSEVQPIFYDYAGKDSYWGWNYQGTNSQPSVISQRMPDGTTYYKYMVRNERSMLTQEVERWVAGGTGLYRTNTYTYASGTSNPQVDGLLRVKHVGPYGELMYGKALHPTYSDQVKYVTNALNEVTTMDYDSSRRVTTRLTPAGLLSTYTYDGTTKRLQSLVDSISGTPLRTNSFTWLNGYLRTHTDPRGLVRTFDYDFLGRLVKIAYPDSTTDDYYYVLPASTGFNTSGSPLAVLDRVAVKDRLTNYWYSLPNRLRQVEKIIEPPRVSGGSGVETTIAYCGCGSPSSVSRASNTASPETTSYSRNYQGGVTTLTRPDSTQVTYGYDSLARLVTQADSLMTLTNVYDNLGRVITRLNGAGLVEGRGYDRRDRQIAITNANGVIVTNSFDALARLTARRNLGDSGLESYGYTANYSPATSYTNQLSNVTTWAYDVAQRKTNEVIVGLMTNSFSYNGANDLLELYDGKQTGTTNRTRWTYDSYGRISLKQYANGVTNLTYIFDPLNRLTNRWSQAKGNTKYQYDTVGNLTNVDYPSSTDLKFKYDALNRVTNMVDAVGTTVFAYSGGLLVNEDGPWASDTVSYGYNGADLRNLMVIDQPTGNAWTNTFVYDSARRLTNVTSPAGSFTNYYVASLNSVTSASGLVLKRGLPGGGYITNQYDSNGRLTDTSLMTNGVVLNRLGYLYDLASERNWISRTNAANASWAGYTTNTYDVASELRTIRAFDGSGSSVASLNFDYGYDAAWNITKRTNNISVTTYTLNNLNQVTSDGNSFTYDNNGNRLMGKSSPSTASYEYDDENQLTAVYIPTYWKETYMYDGRGRLRIRQSYRWDTTYSIWTLAVETRFVYDGMNLAQERTSSNNPGLTYTRGSDFSGTMEGAGGIGGLLARTEHAASSPYQASSSASYQADGNGNIVAMADSTPALVASYRYNPYGAVLNSSGTKAATNSMRFSSKPAWTSVSGNDTGLSYYGFRFYDHLAGRWINRDPIKERGGINIYGFVSNDPLDNWDSQGLFCGVDDAVEGGAAICVAGSCVLMYMLIHPPHFDVGYPGWGDGFGGNGAPSSAISPAPLPALNMGPANGGANAGGRGGKRGQAGSNPNEDKAAADEAKGVSDRGSGKRDREPQVKEPEPEPRPDPLNGRREHYPDPAQEYGPQMPPKDGDFPRPNPSWKCTA
jgi:RHS repeat-associated protein